jgi:hypothetical protein
MLKLILVDQNRRLVFSAVCGLWMLNNVIFGILLIVVGSGLPFSVIWNRNISLVCVVGCDGVYIFALPDAGVFFFYIVYYTMVCEYEMFLCSTKTAPRTLFPHKNIGQCMEKHQMSCRPTWILLILNDDRKVETYIKIIVWYIYANRCVDEAK